MSVGRPAAVVDTNIFGAELTRRGADVAGVYRGRHECVLLGHPLGQKHHEADRWIGATARWLDVPLVAHDAVFPDAPGVAVITDLT